MVVHHAAGFAAAGAASYAAFADAAGAGGPFGLTPAGYGYMVFGAVVTAIGTAVWQPYLRYRERAFQARLDATQAQLDGALVETAANRQKIRELDLALGEYASRERAATERVARLMEQTARMNDRNVRLASMILVQYGRIVAEPPGPDAGPLIGDHLGTEDGPLVLIVEDNVKTREATTMMLESEGFRVEGVGGVAEGVEAVERLRPAAVVLDLMLPDGDGVDVLRRVRELSLPTRVVVTTARHADTLGPVRALDPDALIAKPYRFRSQLLAAIRGEATRADATAPPAAG